MTRSENRLTTNVAFQHDYFAVFFGRRVRSNIELDIQSAFDGVIDGVGEHLCFFANGFCQRCIGSFFLTVCHAIYSSYFSRANIAYGLGPVPP